LGERELAGGIGDGLGLDVGGDIGSGDLGVGNGGATGIGHIAEETGRERLGGRGQGKADK